MPSDLPWSDLASLPVPPPNVDKVEAAASIERYFSSNGIAVIHDGSRFVRLVPNRRKNELLTHAPLGGARFESAPVSNSLPAGAIKMINVPANEVLELYAALTGRTILRSAVISLPGNVTLENASPLSQQGAAYALATSLAMDGLSLVEDGTKFLQVVPWSLRAQVQPRAPKADPVAELFRPGDVPEIGFDRELAAQVPKRRVEQDLQRLKKAAYDLLRITASERPPAQRLLELYATLTDKSADSSTNLSRTPISFHVTTPLSQAELLYAIETTFSLNGLKIIAVDAKRIRLARVSEPGNRITASANGHSIPFGKLRRWRWWVAIIISGVAAFLFWAVRRFKTNH